MIEILIVTHGPLADGLVKTSKLIVGDISSISSIGFELGDDPDELVFSIRKKVQSSLDNGNQLLIFADLLGGSPSNRIAICLNDLEVTDKVEAIVGINLPMLIEALILSETEKDIEKIKHNCMSSGIEGIKDLKETFGI